MRERERLISSESIVDYFVKMEYSCKCEPHNTEGRRKKNTSIDAVRKLTCKNSTDDIG